jgi:hypothetical protein
MLSGRGTQEKEGEWALKVLPMGGRRCLRPERSQVEPSCALKEDKVDATPEGWMWAVNREMVRSDQRDRGGPGQVGGVEERSRGGLR